MEGPLRQFENDCSASPPATRSERDRCGGKSPSLPHRIDSSAFPLTPALSLQGRGSKTATPAPHPLRSQVLALPGGKEETCQPLFGLLRTRFLFVPRERRGGCSAAQRLPHGWSEQIPGHMHHTFSKGEACQESPPGKEHCKVRHHMPPALLQNTPISATTHGAYENHRTDRWHRLG